MSSPLFETDELIRRAIAEKRLIRFRYHGKSRIAEPHDYGVQKGQVRLFSYQVAGESKAGGLPAWRWINVGGISDLTLMGEHFPGSRSESSRQHHVWDKVFMRVA